VLPKKEAKWCRAITDEFDSKNWEFGELIDLSEIH
jgi:hypothetical protein